MESRQINQDPFEGLHFLNYNRREEEEKDEKDFIA
jgi:hypothetical protein